ncbi:hypothetical protein BDW02DRAFT_631799 [Decorospora gaudefroyi]|uniref:Uncharacterized protein n=1 Tax=Decorospora gaudefroyi TaxID=184978 RepID=A0A6A5KE46_9PLEO|nr:hypothetical protein BDW02DRAFT_631799 [Decorospora gaudefroyi]
MVSSHQGISILSSNASSALPGPHQQACDHGEDCTPVKPHRRLGALPTKHFVSGDSSDFSPAGGLDLREYVSGRSIATPSRDLTPSQGPASPPTQANIRVRRVHGSRLLQSPARAGHAARMRQIFEEAGREQPTPQGDRGVLYPQLANISRRASPPPEYSRQAHSPLPPIHRPQTLWMSTDPFHIVPQVNEAQVSDGSSESWSDDSGYLIRKSRTRPAGLTVSSKERIADWLASVSSEGEEALDANGHLCDDQEDPLLDLDDNDNDTLSLKPDDSPSSYVERGQWLASPQPDPFIQDDYNNSSSPLLLNSQMNLSPPSPSNSPYVTHSTVTIRTGRPRPRPRLRPLPASGVSFSPHSPSPPVLLEEGGIQLSPLSPNVCIERGPGRNHSARSKENGSPLAPCKIGVGTRFQHPKHQTFASRQLVRGGEL